MDTILYECMKCHTISPLDDFEDLEWDSDIWGLCPHCGQTGMILEVDTSEPADKLRINYRYGYFKGKSFRKLI